VRAILADPAGPFTARALTRPPPCAPVAPTTAMIFFSVIIYSCDLFSDTDWGLLRRIEALVRLGEQARVAAISMNRFDDEICLRSAECAS
jgi:hypothetical protein